jgi:hypothetical protein
LKLTKLLGTAALFALHAAANATPPPMPRPCQDIGENEISVTSLAHAIKIAADARDRECASTGLRNRGAQAMDTWLALLGSSDPAQQRDASSWIQGTRYLRLQGDSGNYLLTLAALGLPASAIPLQAKLTTAAHYPACSMSDTGYPADAGTQAVPHIAALLADTSLSRPAAICLGAMGDAAYGAMPQLFEQGQWETVPAVGVRTKDEFMQWLNGAARGINRGVPRVRSKLIQQFAALPPELAPILIDYSEAGATEGWVILALKITGSLQAATHLVERGEYQHAADMGKIAEAALLDKLDRLLDLDQLTRMIKALDTLGTPKARAAARQALDRSMPALVAALAQPSYEPFVYMGQRGGGTLPATDRFAMLGRLAIGGRDLVLPLLDSGDAELRVKAARVLGYMQVVEAEPRIVELRNKSRGAGDTSENEGFGKNDITRSYNAAIHDLRKAQAYLSTLSTERQLQLAIDLPRPNSDDQEIPFTEAELARRGAVAELMQAVESWNERVKKHDSMENDRARHVLLPLLKGMGDRAAPEMPQLVRYLNDPRLGHPLGSPGSPLFLARWSVRDPKLVEQLVQQVLDNDNPAGRYYSATVLASMGRITARQAAALRSNLNQPERWSYNGGKPPDELYFALTGRHLDRARILEPALEELVELFVQQRHCYSRKPRNTVEACEGLREKGPGAVRAMLPLLAHADPIVRQGASDFLGSLGESAAQAVDPMLKLLEDPLPLVRQVAADNIGRIVQYEAPPPKLTSYLLRGLAGSDPDMRVAAVVQLVQYRKLPAATIAGIQQALGNEALAHFRSRLLAALGNTHTRQAAVLLNDYLLAASRQAERDDIAAALGRVGDPATQLLVEQSAKTSDPDLLVSYADAMAPQAKARSDALVQALLPGLEIGLEQPGGLQARRSSARRIAALMRFTSKADTLAKAALSHHDREVVEPVLLALAKWGGREILPELQALESQADEWLKPKITSAAAQIRWRHFGPAE